jgi:hypothetical protein
VLICWLALLLTRVAEGGTGFSWRNINRQLERIMQVTLAGPAGTVAQTTPKRRFLKPSADTRPEGAEGPYWRAFGAVRDEFYTGSPSALPSLIA